jgi:hypothetical protein
MKIIAILTSISVSVFLAAASTSLAGSDEQTAARPSAVSPEDRAALEQSRKARAEERSKKALEELNAAALAPLGQNRETIWQQGDGHAAALNGYLDDAIATHTALARSCEQGRPTVEVARALDVFADKYDTLCTGIAQFCSWLAVTRDPIKFSDSGLAQARKFCARLDEFDSSLPQLDTAFAPYANDPALIPSENRILSSIAGMKNILSRLGYLIQN